MFGLIKKMFIGLLSVCTIGSLSGSLVSITIKCVYLTNRSCQARPTIFNINFDETFLSIYCRY